MAKKADWSPVEDPFVLGAIETVVRQRFGDPAHVESVTARVLAHRPHRNRWVFRYRVLYRDESGESQRWRVIGKRFEGMAEAQRVYDSQLKLRANGFAGDAPDRICVPEPYLLLDPPFVLMQDIGGEKLRALLFESGDLDFSRLMARALAKLHACDVEAPLAATTVRRVHRLTLTEDQAAAYPSFVTAIAAVSRCAPEFETPQRLALVHGDFHPGQFHYDGSVAWLLDTGGMGRGDPLYDVGNLVRFIDRNEERLADAAGHRRAFLDEYAARTGLEVERRANFFAALGQLIHARKELPVQPEVIPQLVELCMRNLEAL